MSVQSENEYEDLLGLWSDLESGVGIILGSPASIQEFEQRVWQYDRWMQALLKRDTDVGLYLLFQLATNSPVGYSASHALVCAVLCHLIGVELKLPVNERDSLVHAALTMNIAMTALQDQLAGQVEKPSAEQQSAIRAHAVKGGLMLANMGVTDELWLDTISLHHDESTDRGELRELPAVKRLARILRIVDRYAAMISPRKSREGRSATDSVRSIITNSAEQRDEVGHALVRAVGLCPPGTYVRLDNKELAVVMRRSSKPNHPHVAIVVDQAGALLNPPRLHRTANASPRIQAALAASAVRVRLNHHLILQLGAYAALHP
ncbi:HD domain-containing phosphohydrolase [Rhodoferax sp.]|uniref:HD-GYP domain-containing protein n=1 Tax=Rhodoferax sp. TaxID=50421 RepID=UPI001EBC5439|nr:HD domain-containing phosphohydrolase [Rhodoferax sp.]MBT9505716.1 phosphodiesterase [Rhodoferax sp.]